MVLQRQNDSQAGQIWTMGCILDRLTASCTVAIHVKYNVVILAE